MNSEFSFSITGCHTQVKEPSLPGYFTHTLTFLVRWSIFLSFSFVHFLKPSRVSYKRDCSDVCSFDEISTAERRFEKFSLSLDFYTIFVFFVWVSLKLPSLSLSRLTSALIRSFSLVILFVAIFLNRAIEYRMYLSRRLRSATQRVSW